MTFKEFYMEKFVENNIGLVYANPDAVEFYSRAIPNILGDRPLGGDIGVIFTPKNVYYFDRKEMEHKTCYRKFAKDGKLEDTLPAVLEKNKKNLTFVPAYNSMKEMNFFGYNDAEKYNGSQMKGFLHNGGDGPPKGGYNKMLKFLADHPHIQMLKSNGYLTTLDANRPFI